VTCENGSVQAVEMVAFAHIPANVSAPSLPGLQNMCAELYPDDYLRESEEALRADGENVAGA